MNASAISVALPVRNEAAKIRACLTGILSQSISPREVIVADSGSTDGTLDILAEFPSVTVIRVPPAEFNHGETRNLLVQTASSPFVALTVGDAEPVDHHWLQRLVDGFEDDQVVGVCGQQIVRHDPQHNPLEWFRPVSEPRRKRVQFVSAEAFDRLPPEEKRQACSWDDVTAMYRRDALLRTPFRRTVYGEDALWARDVLRQGAALVWEPRARVYHYHIESPEFAYKRTLTVLVHRHEAFGFHPSLPGRLHETLKALKILQREHSLPLSDRWGWVRYNLAANAARRQAVLDFNQALNQGAESIQQLHDRYCAIAPVPPKARAFCSPTHPTTARAGGDKSIAGSTPSGMP